MVVAFKHRCWFPQIWDLSGSLLWWAELVKVSSFLPRTWTDFFSQGICQHTVIPELQLPAQPLSFPPGYPQKTMETVSKLTGLVLSGPSTHSSLEYRATRQTTGCQLCPQDRRFREEHRVWSEELQSFEELPQPRWLELEPRQGRGTEGQGRACKD